MLGTNNLLPSFVFLAYQKRVAEWVVNAFGVEILKNREERGMRVAEEVLELTQAIGLSRERMHTLVDYVYNRPVGDLNQEFGGTAVTLLAAAESCDIHLGEELEREVTRVESIPVEHFRNKNRMKKEAGVGTYE